MGIKTEDNDSLLKPQFSDISQSKDNLLVSERVKITYERQPITLVLAPTYRC